VALVVAGCGTKAHRHAVALAQTWSAAHDAGGRVSCSSGVGGIRPKLRSPDFLCLVHRSAAVCDELHIQQVKGVWLTSLRRKSVDCVLPA
jgi:hypothetical protein